MGWLMALGVLVPGLSWAAPYQAYSHVETGFLYWGLGAQAVMRASSFRLLPYAVILACAIWLVYRRLYAAQVQPLVSVFVYLIHAALILVLFWPEASYRFFGGVTALRGLVVSVDEGSVFSYVARENGETNDTAATMRLAGVNLTPSGAPVPRALDLMLTIATEAPRRLGERINADMDRPLAHLGAMQALLSQPLESDAARYALTEFHESCYRDAVADMTEDATVTSETTWQERLPWSAEMAPYLAKRVHLDPAGGPSDVLLGLSGTVQCVQIWNALQATVSADLNGEATGGGSTKINVYLNELGIPAQDTVRFVIGQELHKMMERFVEAPGLTGAYATVAGAKAGASMAQEVAGSGSAKKSVWQRVGSALFGTAAEAVEDTASGILGFMRPALFLIWWMPYITGLLSAVVLTFFPFVVLWSLFPGQHVKPLVNYFLMLFFVHSTPLWWSIADAASTMAGDIGSPHAAGWIFESVGEFFRGHAAAVVVGVLAILLVPVIQAVVMFGTWRAIGGIWRG
ncbi:MAG: conjugal transfer protein TraG N-terminal domain-containing protein [Candidatus Tectomicrobia bacterium]|nr:conjugal transfer protein TraG N-terminal domain-containing protein [Candidatus Tectomicrobia bacterium]